MAETSYAFGRGIPAEKLVLLLRKVEVVAQGRPRISRAEEATTREFSDQQVHDIVEHFGNGVEHHIESVLSGSKKMPLLRPPRRAIDRPSAKRPTSQLRSTRYGQSCGCRTVVAGFVESGHERDTKLIEPSMKHHVSALK
jgi:hypothetical protein